MLPAKAAKIGGSSCPCPFVSRLILPCYLPPMRSSSPEGNAHREFPVLSHILRKTYVLPSPASTPIRIGLRITKPAELVCFRKFSRHFYPPEISASCRRGYN